MRPYGSPKQLESRRIEIVRKIVEEGMQVSEAAKRAQVNPRSIYRWLESYNQGGSMAIKAKKHVGPKPHLNEKQILKLEKILLKGALTYGFDSDLWTLPRMVEVVFKEFGVKYHPYGLGPLLRKRGWSFQKTAIKAKERNEIKIRNWIRCSWPRLKKSKDRKIHNYFH